MKTIPLLLVLVLGSWAWGAPVVRSLPVDSSWGRSPVWDDGRAEVAHYESHRRVYTMDRAYETILITVKEDFDRDRAVKAEPPYEGRDLIAVLKLNVLSRIETDNYPYNYMTSLFVKRDDPRTLVKLTGSSQEWCGTTFKEIVTHDGPPRMEFHSYFDTQADGTYPIDLAGGALLEEQLFLVLRAADLERGKEYRIPVYGSLITNSAERPWTQMRSITLGADETLMTPAGPFAARRIDVKPAAEGGPDTVPQLTFWIGKGSDRALVKFESTDGRSLLLSRISRRDYWSRR